MDSRVQIIGANYGPDVKSIVTEAINAERKADLSWLALEEIPNCKNDHGDRTNHKLKDQPFYARGRNGKMRSW